MAVGLPLNKPILDSRVGFLTVTLKTTLEGCATLKNVLDAMPDTDLTDMGYSADDIYVMRGLSAALAKLRNVAHGQDTQAEASDFFFFASRVTALD